jgi:hypothetical protein
MELINDFFTFMEVNQDHRVKNWLGMSSIYPTIALSFSYVLVVKVKVQSAQKLVIFNTFVLVSWTKIHGK